MSEQRKETLELIDEAVGAGARLEKACKVVGLSERTIQRWRLHDGGGDDGRMGPKTVPANKLSDSERRRVLETANSKEFRDLSPKQIVPTLADRGVYIASESTFYRVLREEGLMKHRGQTRAPRPRPRELVATGPNQVHSWDITYMRSPVRGLFFYLYMFVDVWSRKIVGWEVHEEESMNHSARLVERICVAEGVGRDTLTLHADNGGPMKGSTMLAMLEGLGIAASFSRPCVSDDNPISESLFRTMKYRPEFPRDPFQTIEDARGWVERFVAWYNEEHLHSGINFVSPGDRHGGRHRAILTHRERVYADAQQRRPGRWAGAARDWTPTAEVRLNPGRPGKAA